jgi:hypothetical protein
MGFAAAVYKQSAAPGMPRAGVSTIVSLCEENITYRRQITVPKPKNRSLARLSADSRSAFHVDDNHQLHASIGEPAVHGDTLIESVQESEIVADCL